jgi:hypothetical protein
MLSVFFLLICSFAHRLELGYEQDAKRVVIEFAAHNRSWLVGTLSRRNSLQDSNEYAPKPDHADQLIFCVFDSTKIKPSQFIRQSQRFLTKRQDVSKIPMFQFLLCCHALFLFHSEGTFISITPLAITFKMDDPSDTQPDFVLPPYPSK